MAWTDLTFVGCSVLTAAKMTQLQDNFAALAAQESGAPLVAFPNSPLVANAGMHTTGVGSFGAVHAGSGFSGPQVSSFGTVEVGSNASFFGGLRFPHFALRFNPGNPPTIIRQTNVSCLQRTGTGTYAVHLAAPFTNSSYYLLAMAGLDRNSAWDGRNGDLSLVTIYSLDSTGVAQDTSGQGTCVIGFGD